jgi:hypothetical protein
MTYDPTWSADGKWIYVRSKRDAPDISRVPSGGGQAVPLSTVSGGFDEEVLYFADRRFRSTIHGVSLRGGHRALPLDGMPQVNNWNAWTAVRGGIYFVPAGFLTLFVITISPPRRSATSSNWRNISATAYPFRPMAVIFCTLSSTISIPTQWSSRITGSWTGEYGTHSRRNILANWPASGRFVSSAAQRLDGICLAMQSYLSQAGKALAKRGRTT